MNLERLMGLLWVAFLLYWLISAGFTKRRARRSARQRGALTVRLVVAALLLLFYLSERFGGPRGWSERLVRVPVPAIPVRLLGVALCLLGFAIAVWARVTLGRNWGPPMSMRVGHALVTRGPYARIRHPIYAGLLLAAIGSGLAQSALWLVLFILLFGYFLYSARAEERLMCELFPEDYPDYRRRTWMLIPFLL